MLNDAAILKSLDIRTGQTILDAGCGNGYMAKKFSRLVGNSGKIYALDIDRGFIDRLKNEVVNSNIEAMTGDITAHTVLNSSSIDLIYLSTVFHIFTNAQIGGFVNEVKRLLKPNGRLAVVNINKEDTPFGPPLKMRSSPEEMMLKLPFTCDKTVKAGEHFYMQIFKTGG